MKKTKIIAPALAIIAFSTAASIAGSVAWFTASRQVAINAGSYAVIKTNSDLTYDMAAGVGTGVNVDTNTVTFSGKLTHGSFNHADKTVYTPAADGKSIAKGTLLTDANFATEMLVRTIDDVNVYTAATFKITFTMNFGSGELDKGLYLDTTASNFTTTGALATAKGFRMAFVPDTVTSGSSAVARVFADLQASANCKYVNGTDNINGVAYTGNDLIDNSYSAALPDSTVNRATAIARPDYLGTFVAPTGTNPLVSLTFYVVAWFEGTDPEIINRDTAAEYQEVATHLVFEAVDLKAAS